MGWRDATVRNVQRILGVKESVPAVRVEDIGYRRLSTSENRENLNPLNQDTLLKIVRALYYINPGGRRLTEIPADYAYKATVKIRKDADEKVQDIIDRFWDHPLNDMNRFVGDMNERFNLDGELLLPVIVNPQDGFVRLTYEEPTEISKIEGYSLDKKLIDTITLRGKRGEKEKKLKVIRFEDDPSSTVKTGSEAIGNVKEVHSYGYRTGDCFYFRQCHLITGRGRPPLEPVLDWLDAHDHALFDQLRNVSLQSAFVWDLNLTGATQAQVDARAEKVKKDGPMKPGTVLVHNDSEVWEAKSPKLDTRVATDLLLEVRRYYGFGSAKSETWVNASQDVNRACYSEDTETLTEHGWKKYFEVEPQEKIATYNPKTDRIEFHEPIGVYVYPYEGEMFYFNGRTTDILVTPEHKMWVRPYDKGSSYELIPANEIPVNRFQFLAAAEKSGGEAPSRFVLPPIYKQSHIDEVVDFALDDWLEFLGYVISEGGISSQSNKGVMTLAQKEPVNAALIELCLRRMGLNFTPYKDGDLTRFNIYGKTLVDFLKNTVGMYCSEKCIPEYVFSLPVEKLKILFDALMLGDGSEDLRGDRKCGSYSTTSHRLADDFQRLALFLGYRTSVRVHYEAYGNRKTCYRVNISWGFREVEIQAARNLEKVSYSGMVYCFEVPNHLFVTRRNGCITIQGNTAMVSDTPPQRHLERQQYQFELIIRDIINFVIDQAILCGSLTVAEDKRDFDVILPDLTTADNKATVESLKLLAEAMLLAMDGKLTDVETGRQLFYRIANMEQPKSLDEEPSEIVPKPYISKQDIGDRNTKDQKVDSDGLPKVAV